MDNPAVFVLLLEQGGRSLEDHTEDFVFLANLTHYSDNCLCSFYQAGLNTSTRAQLSGDGPRESLTAFIEWVLVSCKSHLTVDMADNDTSPTRDPEPSQLPPRNAELPEPTADRESEPAAVVEPSPSRATERTIVPESELQVSDQVREPTAQATVDTAVEIAGAMDSPTHGATAGGEHELDLGDLIDFHSDTLVIHPSPELYTWEYIPPNLPLPPPLIDLAPVSTPSSLDSVSLSAHPQRHGLAAGLPISSSVGVESGGTLDSAFSLQGPDSASVLRPSGSTLASSSLISTGACQSTGSTLALRILGITLALRLSVAASTTTCSAAVGWPHGVGGHSSTMAPPSVGSSMGHHRDCGLGPAGLLLLQVPPVSILAPPSDLPWLLPSPPWTLLVVLFPGVRPPPEPPPVLSACLPSCQPFAVPVTIPHPLLFPPPKSPTVPPFVPRCEATFSQEDWTGQLFVCHVIQHEREPYFVFSCVFGNLQ